MSKEDDVYGALLDDVLAGRRVSEIDERDDGLLMVFDAEYLVAPFTRWSDPTERKAMRFVRGRVLDVGCGGGRVCLHLQDRGLDVVGIDASPGAVAVCKRRGVLDARQMRIEDVPTTWGPFDTMVFLGQNFGMLGSLSRARRILRRLARLTNGRGRIVAETFDPHGLDDPVQRRYLARNVARGRMPGQLRVRMRHRELATRWMDWLQVSKDELRDLLEGTGWALSRTIGDGPSYVAIIDQTR